MSLMGELTEFLGDTTMALAEDGAGPGPRQRERPDGSSAAGYSEEIRLALEGIRFPPNDLKQSLGLCISLILFSWRSYRSASFRPGPETAFQIHRVFHAHILCQLCRQNGSSTSLAVEDHFFP